MFITYIKINKFHTAPYKDTFSQLVIITVVSIKYKHVFFNATYLFMHIYTYLINTDPITMFIYMLVIYYLFIHLFCEYVNNVYRTIYNYIFPKYPHFLILTLGHRLIVAYMSIYFYIALYNYLLFILNIPNRYYVLFVGFVFTYRHIYYEPLLITCCYAIINFKLYIYLPSNFNIFLSVVYINYSLIHYYILYNTQFNIHSLLLIKIYNNKYSTSIMKQTIKIPPRNEFSAKRRKQSHRKSTAIDSTENKCLNRNGIEAGGAENSRLEYDGENSRSLLIIITTNITVNYFKMLENIKGNRADTNIIIHIIIFIYYIYNHFKVRERDREKRVETSNTNRQIVYREGVNDGNNRWTQDEIERREKIGM